MRAYEIVKKNTKKILPYQIITYILSLTTIILSAMLINCMQALVNVVQSGGREPDLYAKLLLLCILYFIFMITFQFVFKRTQIIGGYEVMAMLYNKLQEKPVLFFRNNTFGEIISIINNEGRTVGDWISFGVLVLLNEFSVLIMSLGMMFYYNVSLTLILLGIMLVLFLLTKVLTMKMAQLSAESQTITAKINQFLLETMKAETLIHMLEKNAWFKMRFSNLLFNERYPIDKKRAELNALYTTIFALLAVLLPIIAVGIGALMISEQRISMGTLLAFYAYTVQLQEPVRYIPDFLSQRKNVLALAEHLLPIIEEIPRGENYKILKDRTDELSVNIKYFSYGENEKRILKNIQFHVSASQILLIKGNSGVGKTTLIDLIMGFLVSESASIMQNGRNCSKVSDQERWRHTLLVEQEPLLLEGTLKDNLFLGDEFTGELLNEVIRSTCLEAFVAENGMEKMIIGGAEGISGGQKQRICIARMLLRIPDILILDEPTSALDERTSLELAKGVTEFAKKYAIILLVVSHKSDFDQYATSVLKIV